MPMIERLAGDGEMADRTRAFPWTDTPLGPIDAWPVSLRSAAALMIESRFPMSLWWGPELSVLYNDAYVPVLAGKHPGALGRRAPDVWAEIWHILGPQTQRVLDGAGATWNEHLLLPMQRKGFVEETYFTFSYSPLRDDRAIIQGVLITCQETTAQVQGERQLQLLRDLAACTADRRSADDVCVAAATVFDQHAADIPFALLYLADTPDGVRLAASAGFSPATAHPAVPMHLAVPSAAAGWALEMADRADSGVSVVAVPVDAGPLPSGPWELPPHHAVIVALKPGGGTAPVGYLVAGLNPLREIDHGYTQVFGLVADQIVRALGAARAFEEERRRAEALAEIDRQKSVFFSNISHEFRTPLTLMIGPTEDALGTADRSLGGEALELVYRNELRLLKLVNALLDFARLEAGHMVASYEATDLAQYTADLASTFRSAFERAGLAFTVTCDPVGEDVYVDRGMWEKVVLNLLSNALKFTFEGGVQLRLTAGPPQVTLSVQDTGIGIGPADLPRLFQRFHRIEGVRARTHEGSGIGLALVNDLVRLHGGTCTVASELGEGTTVTVTVPTGRAHLAAGQVRGISAVPATPAALPAQRFHPIALEAQRWVAEPAAPAPPEPLTADATTKTESFPGAHLLVADDNADMREYLARMLRRHWSVETVGDGTEALATIRQRRPDLLITDVMMPGLDGFALLRTLRQDPATAALPVIMLSARAGEEARVDGLRAGADDYLVKPFSARELIARVQAHLRLAEAARERADLLARAQQAREDAEFQRQQLRSVFDQAPTLIAVFRGPDHIVELANDRICEAWGRRQADLLGRPFFDAVPEGRDQSWRALLDGVFHRGEPYLGRDVAAQFIRDGHLTTSYYDFVWSPLREHGTVAGVIVVASDVTDQVIARRQLSGLREAAESANRAKDEFLAMLGHELRNPLAPIMTALQLLKLRGIETGERERAIIERQVRHVVALVDDLLDVSRITRGKLELKRSVVELSDIVGKAIEMASPMFEQQRHEVHVDVLRTGLGLYGDANRLAQVVANLLTNAAKYTEPGGLIEVDGGLEDDEVVLRVRDSGIGIAGDMLPRIFDLFVQEPQSSARSRGGLGLGLTIVRSLVTLHGGTVSAESEGTGRGATFTIRLPHERSADGLADADRPGSDDDLARAHHLDLRVLVVDDNVDAAELLAAMLATFGCEALAVHDGPAALEAAPAFRPDVALLDIGLPVMDGHELARRLALVPGMDRLRLVAVTGYGQAPDRERSEEAGFDAHLVKPIDATRLRETLLTFAASASPPVNG